MSGHSPASVPDVLSSTDEPRVAPPSPLELTEIFDDLLALAAHVSGAPVAVLTVGQEARAWKAGSEANPSDLWREIRFCTAALQASDGLAIIPDTAADSHWRTHPFVRGEPGIRFFGGTPLITADGHVLGQLCVLGYEPHRLGASQRAALARVARQAVKQFNALTAQTAATALTRSEARFRTLVNQAPAGFLLLDATGHTTYATEAITRLMGNDVHEIVGRDIFTFVHPEDKPLAMETFANLLATPQTKAMVEVRCLQKGGGWKWMEAVALNCLHDPAVEAISVNLWDISDRKKAAEGLRDSERRMRRIMDSNVVGIFFWHLDGRIVDANERFLEMIGYTRADLAADRVSWLALTPPEFNHLDQAGVKQIEANGICTPYEKEYVRKDGTRVPILLGAATLEGSSDQGVAFIVNVADRKQIESDLLRERNLLRTLIDHIPDYIYVKDTQARFLVNNKANVNLIGAGSAEEVAGKTVFDFFPKDVAERYEADDRAILRSGQNLANREEPCVGRNGEPRQLHTTKVPLRDENGKIIGLVGISRDITEQLTLEAQLRRSQKMECVGQLAGGVAHDFNNILTVIHGHAALLAGDALTPGQRESMEEITKAADRAASLTRQLLAFGRRHIIQPRNLDLNDTLAQMAKVLQRVLGEDIELEVRYASNLPPVFADPGMFEQVGRNLAVNSRDAMPKGGQIHVGLRAVALDRHAAQAFADGRPGTFVVLSVSDSGSGMPPEVMEHIFEPFFTTKEVGHGSGLGLATVYGIVQQHHGWITVHSEINRGTRFEIFLPASEKPATPTVTPPRKVQGGAETILLVEDEEPLRELVRCVLESYGYKVVDAPSGRQALDIWKQHHKSFDLLLTDIVMPEGVTGRDLADALKQEKPELRVLFSSGYSADIIGKDFVLSDGINFLQKPYNPQTLAETVRHCLDR